MSDELNISLYDRSLLTDIRYNLETIAANLTKLRPASFYETDVAIINLNQASHIAKAAGYAEIWFSFSTNETEAAYSKKFESIEARDTEFERIKTILIQK